MAKKKGKGKVARSPVVSKPSDLAPANGDVVFPTPGPMIMPAKVCRLCETKEGPYLNIFGGEKNTAKKIEALMPFSIAENDELPHKICFRCSAKVEELHEFVQKCIKTQENLYNTLGKKCPLTTKVKTHRSLWEEQLNKSNITNDDICDAVIKKAMEGIKDIALSQKSDLNKTEPKQAKDTSMSIHKKAPVTSSSIKQPLDSEKSTENEPKRNKSEDSKKSTKEVVSSNENKTDISGELNSSTQNIERKTTRTSLRSRNSEVPIPADKEIASKVKRTPNRGKSNTNAKSESVPEETGKPSNIEPENKTVPAVQDVPKEEAKPFDIMLHVSMIKVNGVGVLFQCKLCNRNFLKKDVVLAHWCAKNGAAKEDITKKVAPPEPPKAPTTVKYINTKTDNYVKIAHGNANKSSDSDDVIEVKEDIKPAVAQTKAKPKIGPASKVKKSSDVQGPLVGMKVTPREPSPTHLKKNPPPIVQCGTAPSLNCRYKLVPGANNTFTLVEVFPDDQNSEPSSKDITPKKRKTSVDDSRENPPESSAKQKKVSHNVKDKKGDSSPEIINVEDSSKFRQQEPPKKPDSVSQPYPVGLFQTVKPHPKERENSKANLVPFVTSAQKKQSYQIVQTGNPSKLLISAKPNPQPNESLKKHKKKDNPPTAATSKQEPFSVTLQEADHAKDSGFFTFVNLDPLLQPSYVLPTDNSILQESQISTSHHAKTSSSSKAKDQYTCNMCNEKFNREQKLLVHIHSHYSKMDEEDQGRTDKGSGKKRSRKT